MRLPPQSAAAALLVLAALFPSRALSQRRAAGPESSLLIGPSRYDLGTSGTGISGLLSLTFRPVPRILLLEPALGYLTYRNQFGQRDHWFFPELSAQAELGLGAVRPYLGGGGGGGVATVIGPDKWYGALHAVAGLRVRLGSGWGGRAEARVRAVPPWSRHTTDFGFGVVYGIR